MANTTEDKLRKLLKNKDDIKNAINNCLEEQQEVMPENTPLSDYDTYIKRIKPIDTRDATAVAGDILNGKTAYANGQKVTGNMPNNGAINITPSKQQQSIPAGYTSGGTVGAINNQNKSVTPGYNQQVITPDSEYDGLDQVTVEGDSDLVSSNIKSGVSIFGVNGISSVVDTLDATADADDIISPKNAYIAGQKVTGSSYISKTNLGYGIYTDTTISISPLLMLQTYNNKKMFSISQDEKYFVVLGTRLNPTTAQTENALLIKNLITNTAVTYSLTDLGMDDYTWADINTSAVANDQFYICVCSISGNRIGNLLYNELTESLSQFRSIDLGFIDLSTGGVTQDLSITRYNTITDKFIVSGNNMITVHEGYGFTFVYNASTNTIVYSSTAETRNANDFGIIDYQDRFFSKICVGSAYWAAPAEQYIYWLDANGVPTTKTNYPVRNYSAATYFYYNDYEDALFAYYPDQKKTQKVLVNIVDHTISTTGESIDVDFGNISTAGIGVLLINKDILTSNNSNANPDSASDYTSFNGVNVGATEYTNRSAVLAYGKNNIFNNYTRWYYYDSNLSTTNIHVSGINDTGNYRNDSFHYKDQTFFNVDDADSTSSDIKVGKTAYAGTQKITGTMPEVINPTSIDGSFNGAFFKPDDAVTNNGYGTYTVTDTQGQHIGTSYLVNWVKVTNEQTWFINNQQKVKVGLPFSAIASAIGLTANKIKQGETILGITGTYTGIDTSDATATPSDIAYGKTAYVNGQKITGTMPIGRSYVRLQYIQSSGTQHIDTGYKFTSTHQKVELIFNPVVIEDARICGSFTSSGGNHCGMIVQPRQTNMFEVGDKSITPSFGISANTLYNCSLDVNNGNVTYKLNNNTGTNTCTADRIITNMNHYIFAVNFSSKENSSIKLYSYKMYDNGVLVRDFIPVKRKSDNEICMYDLVTETFFTNQGTGTFIAGPEITELEYIESTGTQYINTGIIGNNTKSMELKVNRLNSTNQAALFGAWSNSNCVMGEINRNKWSYFYKTTGSEHTQDISASDGIKTIFFNSTQMGIKNEEGTVESYMDYSASTWTTNLNIYLFARNQNGSANNPSSIRLYSCKLYDNDTLVRDLIPVQDENNTVCLWDKVSCTYIYNSGTGVFTAGPEL